MAKLTIFNDFLNEKLGVNEDVKKLTNIIYDAVVHNIDKLKNDKILIFNNFLQNNYQDLVIFNDKLIFKISDNFHAGIINQKNKNNLIVYLEIVFNVNISEIHKLKQIINHELTHIIENLYSKELSKDWDIYQKFKEHQKIFKNYPTWIDISNIFYDILSHELRSRTSSTYEILKSLNTKDMEILKKTIISSSEYKKLNDILNIEPDKILQILKDEYPNYNEILSHFMMNVFNKNYTDDNFIKLFNNMKYKVQKQIKKLLRLVSTILLEKNGYFEEFDDKNINYSEYIKTKLKK